jgi:A/G-specific adenine glycosylase
MLRQRPRSCGRSRQVQCQLSLAQATALRRRLRAFYRASQRDLPWRRSRDPYAVWVSEIMLQQTQVDTVVPRYLAFLRQFPSIAHLAAAAEHQICEAWAGLGYYRRARLMHQAATMLVSQNRTALPGSLPELLALPGIGAYTAGAIASIAFGLPAPLVDGNVERVLSRHFALDEPPRTAVGKRHLWSLATSLMSRHAPGEINQGLMELGALICRPRAPQCPRCPWRATCMAAAQNNPRQPLFIAYAWASHNGRLWLNRRPLAGLWAGLWEPPAEQGTSEAAAAAALQQALGPLGPCLGEVRHTLTHRDVCAKIYRIGDLPWSVRSDRRRVSDPLAAPLSTLARKAIVCGLQACAAQDAA